MVALWEEITSFTGNHNYTLHTTTLPCFSNAKMVSFVRDRLTKKNRDLSGILVELRGCGFNKNIIYTLKRILTTKPAILNATVAVIVVTCESQASQGCSPAIRNQTFLRGCAFSANKVVLINRQWDSDRSFNCGIVENELERVSAYRGVAPQVR